MKPNNRTRVSFANRAARMVVGGYLVLSFFTPLVSLNAFASSPTGVMACCIGKSSGHCSSGLLKKVRVRPKPEPMCGAKSRTARDEMTVVATSSSADDENKAPESQATAEDPRMGSAPSSFSAYFVGQCAVTCCAALANAVRQPQPRENSDLPVAGRRVLPLQTPVSNGFHSRLCNSDDASKQSIPRGPPFSSY
jgi:hypothetical protein